MDSVALTFRLYRLSWQIKAQAVEASFRRFVRACKYNPNQPRVLAGNADGGQWTDGDGGGAAAERTTEEATPSNAERVTDDFAGGEDRIAGGFDDEDMGTTVESFVAMRCKAFIHEVLPGQFYDKTIGEVGALAKAGDPMARRCMKLLSRGKYRK
ncbi:hypothetical protein A7A08_01635 [Methyloligella halotolerans]|uniref:Uncharacterized protein n=1 Tax=Methyloligella halotolerans TaxID=1177755 RepID=A0A1E2RZG8_9HYPH|nr:hypothetical protein [Methyloligella halotolerans]ODA67601.1 hypothetical protein A7A08_01635 [Methyloligella halotolerans]